MQRFGYYVPAAVLLPLFVLALATLGAAAASTASADTSNAFALKMAPCEVTSESQFVPGEILMVLGPGADIGPILEEEGEPPDAAELMFDEDLAELIFGDWYVVSVPEGEELAKCRAYAMHLEVLIAEPNFIRILHDTIPTPYPQSTITVRFVNNGQPVTAAMAHMGRSADEVECPVFQLGAISTVSQFSMPWPVAELSRAPECQKGPPTLLRFEFLLTTPAGDEGLRLSLEATWEGNDLVLDLNIPDPFVFAPAPNPNGLPSGGGPPEGGSTPAVILIVAGVALLALSAAGAFSQRSKPSTMPDNSQRGE